MNQDINYVYLHIKLTDGTPFYVGKGKNNRAFDKIQRSKWWKRTVDKYGYDIIILEEGLTEQEAFEKEIYWIDRIGRRNLTKGPLINMTDGGEGASGYNHTSEAIEKMKGRIPPNKGKKTKQESIDKMVATKKSRTYIITEETRLKLSIVGKGRKCNEHTKKKISESNKGLNTWTKNYKHSEETKLKMSESSKHNKLVIDLETGIFYYNCKEASLSKNINYSTLKSMLNGSKKNKTTLIYI